MAPIVAPLQESFEGGEISPLFYGRVSSDRYKNSLALCRNWLPTVQGGLSRRPGTVYVGTPRDSSARLLPFNFSNTQSYIIEIGTFSSVGYIRFWANYGQVVSGGNPVQIAHPYLTNEISQISYVQDADVLFLMHPAHPVMKLERFSATSWQLNPAVFKDGPYTNIEPLSTLSSGALGATSGATTFTVTTLLAITGAANNGAGLIRITVADTTPFESGQMYHVTNVTGTTEANGDWLVTVIDSTHIDLQGSAFVHAYISGGVIGDAPFANAAAGQLLRLQVVDSSWVWAVITSIVSSLQANIYLQKTATSQTVVAYALGLWSSINGYPSIASFHQSRLCFNGPPSDPQRIDGSVSNDYQNFAPTENDGTVADNNAISFPLNATDVNTLQWFSSDERGLLAGSSSAEWDMRASTTGVALTPTNVNVVRSTKWGSTPYILAKLVGKCTLYVQRGARKLRELMYSWDIDGYRATDLTELAEHITGSGVADIAYQSVPVSIVWLLRNDGALIGCTYSRENLQTMKVGWHQHVLGFAPDQLGPVNRVNSIACIPSPDGSKDDLWMIVNRGGAYTIEYLSKIFEDIDDPSFAIFLDSAQTYNQPVAVTSTSVASVCTITAPAHGFSTGDSVLISLIFPTFPISPTDSLAKVAGKYYTITVVNSNSFTIPVDTTGLHNYGTVADARKRVTVISGLDPKSTQTVSILADGAVQPPAQVDGMGNLTLSQPAAIVTVGFPYNSDAQMLRLEAGARNGTALGKTRRTHQLGILVHRAGAGLLVGPSFDSQDPVLFRIQNVDKNGYACGLFSGIISEKVEFDYDYDNQICMRVNSPMPCTISAVMPMMETQDNM